MATVPKGPRYTAGTRLYQAGWNMEDGVLAKLVDLPWTAVSKHYNRISKIANAESAKDPPKRDFWMGVNDAAWAYYLIRRDAMKAEFFAKKRTSEYLGPGADPDELVAETVQQ